MPYFASVSCVIGVKYLQISWFRANRSTRAAKVEQTVRTEKINKKEGPVAFLLWGAKAKSVLPLLTNPDHLILMSPHPSPFSANRGFFGNNHFKLANEYLISHGQTPIDWTRSNV